MTKNDTSRLWFAAALAIGGGTSAQAAETIQAAGPIQHVVVIMQENRSFDSYFGTYPGADGIPAGVCIPIDVLRKNRGCVAPFHDPHDSNAGGPHDAVAAKSDLRDGIKGARNDGFVSEQERSGKRHCTVNNPQCGGSVDGAARDDAMGYHTAEEIPNYWAYAQHFVLQDQLFEGERSWSLPSHLGLVSEWVATCKNDRVAATCVTDVDAVKPGKKTIYPWENLFHLLDVHAVSWKYYLGEGTEPDCQDGQMTCDPQAQVTEVPSIWNPAPAFAWVKSQGANYLTAHNPPIDQILVDIRAGSLPQVSWVMPAQAYSEHPPAGVTAGMEYVTSIVNAVMQSPYWQNTAIFVTWDDWGGFYDHVTPPNVDRNKMRGTPIEGYGLRVPGLLISAYAKPGMIDHAVLSFDSYATLIEDLFLGGLRLDPAALGNPDHRPSIRDAITQVTDGNGRLVPVGKLIDEFNFNQAPLPPLVLSTHIPTNIAISCRKNRHDHLQHCDGPIVTVAWDDVASASVPGPFTYHVTRDGTPVANCTTSSLSCTDVPGRGSHLYRAYSVDRNNVASPLSAAAEAVVP